MTVFWSACDLSFIKEYNALIYIRNVFLDLSVADTMRCVSTDNAGSEAEENSTNQSPSSTKQQT